MGTAERRSQIMKILCRRRHETIGNLANEFGVSERTIRRDIEILSLTEPIYTQTGRYHGGIYIMPDYTLDRMYMTESELLVIQKLCDVAENQFFGLLSTNELHTLKKIFTDYSKPQVNRRRTSS